MRPALACQRTLGTSPVDTQSRRTRHPHAATLQAVRRAIRVVQAGLPAGLPSLAYRQALEIELRALGVSVRSDAAIPIHYKGVRLTAHYLVDLVCADTIILVILPAGSDDPGWLAHCLEASGTLTALGVRFGRGEVAVREWTRAARPRLVAEPPP